MRKISNIVHLGVTTGVLSILIAVFGSTAMGQCGMSLSSALSAPVLARTRPAEPRIAVKPDVDLIADSSVNPSIVGFWHVRFLVGDTTIQEAFQIYNQGGTEVHNPKVDPRTGTVCLGAWVDIAPRTFKLVHRVWFYDTEGNFQGTGHLTEMLTLDERGSRQTGTFTLEIFDPNGNLVTTVPGDVVGERISAR